MGLYINKLDPERRNGTRYGRTRIQQNPVKNEGQGYNSGPVV